MNGSQQWIAKEHNEIYIYRFLMAQKITKLESPTEALKPEYLKGCEKETHDF